MGLEFIDVYSKDVLFIIEDKWLDYFETAYFNSFNEKHCDLIDRYGTFRLEINHLKSLQVVLQKDSNKPVIAHDFLVFTQKCIGNDIVLKAYVD